MTQDEADSLHAWMNRLALPSDSQLPDQLAAADSVESSGESHSTRSASPADIRHTLLTSVSRAAMACEFECLFNQHQYEQAAEQAMAALDLIEDLERLLSVYKPRSELSVLNRFGSERPIPLSHDSLVLLQLARAAHAWTNGAFDITAGKLSEIWGFARRQGKMPQEQEVSAALEEVDSAYLSIDSTAAHAHFTRPGVQVNPGGIGKGYALDRAAGKLFENGISDFMIHGGRSSVTACGDRAHPETGGGWLVALRHPWNWEQTLGLIRLKNQSLATSGSGKQFFHFGGKRYSHVLDPRTGWPADGLMSSTVVCRSAAVADTLATALFVMSPEEIAAFCDRHVDITAIVVRPGKNRNRPTIETYNMPDAMWQPTENSARL